MKDASGQNDREYANEDDFPLFDGRKMCPRCSRCEGCCEVGVGTFEPFKNSSVLRARYVGSSCLLREPDPNLPAKWQAWFCKGGCDKKGKNHKGPYFPSFIGYINLSIGGKP